MGDAVRRDKLVDRALLYAFDGVPAQNTVGYESIYLCRAFLLKKFGCAGYLLE